MRREGHILRIFSRTVALFSRLKALVASISKIASLFLLLNSLRRAWIACSVPAVCPRQSWLLPPVLWSSEPIHLEMHRPIIWRRTSPIPIGCTPGHLSSEISLLLLCASNEVLGNISVAILYACFDTVFRRLIEALSNGVRSLLHWQESRPECPCDPFVFWAVLSIALSSIISKVELWKGNGLAFSWLKRQERFIGWPLGCFSARISVTVLFPILSLSDKTLPFASLSSVLMELPIFQSFMNSVKFLRGCHWRSAPLRFRTWSAFTSVRKSSSLPWFHSWSLRITVLLTESVPFFVRARIKWGKTMAAVIAQLVWDVSSASGRSASSGDSPKALLLLKFLSLVNFGFQRTTSR